MQQHTSGATIVRWKGFESGMAEQSTELLRESLNFFERLRQERTIDNYRVFMNLTSPGGYVILEGNVDTLVDQVHNPGYREWLLSCQQVLTGFEVITTVGGADGEATEILRQIENAQRSVQQQRSFSGSSPPDQQLQPSYRSEGRYESWRQPQPASR